MIKYTVKVQYLRFEFEDAVKAVQFAQDALLYRSDYDTEVEIIMDEVPDKEGRYE